MVGGTILQIGPPPAQAWQYGAALAAVIALTYLEFKGYGRLWPVEPPRD